MSNSCWMQEIRTQNIGWLISVIKRAYSQDRCVSKQRMYAEMAIQKGVGKKAFEEYIEVLIANKDIIIDTDGDTIVYNSKENKAEEDFKKIGI